MSPIKLVYLKELREMLRDKRTRTAAFFGPIFMMVFFICGFGTVLQDLGKPASQVYHYVGESNSLIAQLRSEGTKCIQITSVGSPGTELEFAL